VLALGLCRHSRTAWWFVPAVPLLLTIALVLFGAFEVSGVSEYAWRNPRTMVDVAALTALAVFPAAVWRAIDPPQVSDPMAPRWRGALVV
jgi:hypothetical protein